jgi:putative membrane protein
MAMGIMLRVIFNAIGLLATTIVPGIVFTGSWVQLIVGGAILGLFNLIVRPLALLLSVPALILTLGLFYFVLNGFLLWVVQFLIPGYLVQGLLPGILGSLVLMVVNWVLHGLFGRSK